MQAIVKATGKLLMRPVVISFGFSTIGIMLGLSTIAGAQTRFEEPPHPVDIGSYLYAEQCFAAVRRMTFADRAHDAILYDTLKFGGQLSDTMPFGPQVVDAARRCSTRWSSGNVAGETFGPLLRVLLAGGRDADAEALFRNRLAAVSPGDDTLRAALLMETARAFMEARPVRAALVESLVPELAQLKKSEYRTQERLDLAWTLIKFALDAGDSSLLERSLARSLENGRTVTSDERKNSWYEITGRDRLRAVVEKKYETQVLDALSRGAQAYRRRVDSLFRQELGFEYVSLGASGIRNIRGDFWFPEKPDGSRPAVGRVSLVFDMRIMDCREGRENQQSCHGFYALMKRVKQRFPEIDIIIRASNLGYYNDQAPPAPAQEARLIGDWLLNTLKLPVTLAIEDVPSFQLPQPDGRFILNWRALEDWETLKMGKGMIGKYFFSIVGRDGDVVRYYDSYTTLAEDDMMKMLAVLFAKKEP